MIDGNAGNDADFFALFLELLAYVRSNGLFIHSKSDHAAVGLDACGNRSGSGGGIRAKRGGVMGGCNASNRELREVEILGGDFAGSVVAPVNLGGVHLDVAHAIAYK